jgi:hypothetical protein
MTVIDWLLDSDPSIRWQVMRDQTYEPTDVIATERSRVVTEGPGARLLALQESAGGEDSSGMAVTVRPVRWGSANLCCVTCHLIPVSAQRRRVEAARVSGNRSRV